MGEKTAGVGHFTIPTAPAAGTSCTSGAANVFTTTYVQLIASTAAALFITGIHVEKAAASAATYCVVQLATGAAAAETIIGQYLVPLSTGSTVALGYRPIYPPIPVANATRISCKTADSVGTQAALITLECIAQSNVVDDGVAVATVTTVTNQLTPAQVAAAVWQDTVAADFTVAASVGKSVMNGVALGTGLTVARCTLADTLTTYTGNTPQTGDSFARIGAAGAGLTALGDARIANLDATVSSRSTYAGTDTAGTTTLLARLTAGRAANLDNLDAAVSTRLASASYTVPPTAVAIRAEIDANSVGLAAIFARTDVATSTRLATAGYTTPPTTAAIADKLLGRNLAGGADGTRTVADAMRALRNKTSLAAGVLTVYAEDDTTPAWTAVVTQAARDPITSVDPA